MHVCQLPLIVFFHCNLCFYTLNSTWKTGFTHDRFGMILEHHDCQVWFEDSNVQMIVDQVNGKMSLLDSSNQKILINMIDTDELGCNRDQGTGDIFCPEVIKASLSCE